jgi:glyoxylase-like metal-dependent hydrolase (beta-lactamase superfamily II)
LSVLRDAGYAPAAVKPERVASGIWRWTARHPQWHPGEFGAEVASFALEAGGDLLLLDPLLSADDAQPLLDLLDDLAADRAVHALITIGYHVRSAEPLCERYGGRVHGPRTCASRLRDPGLFSELELGRPGPGGVTAFPIGRPRRTERPLWFPSHSALAFGDALVATPDGDLRIWSQDPVDERRLRWYRERFAPTLDPLLELPAERILVAHGEAVLEHGAEALRAAVAAEPWYHHG